MRFVVARSRAAKRVGAWRAVVKEQPEDPVAEVAMTAQGSKVAAAMTAHAIVAAAAVGMAAAPPRKEDCAAADDGSAADAGSTEPSDGDANSDGGWPAGGRRGRGDFGPVDSDSSACSDRGCGEESPVARASPWGSLPPTPSSTPPPTPKPSARLPQPVESLAPAAAAALATNTPALATGELLSASPALSAREYSPSVLLQARRLVEGDDAPWLVPGALRTAPRDHRRASKIVAVARGEVPAAAAAVAADLPASSPTSWAAAQQRRRALSSDEEEVCGIPSDTDIRRRVISILNKLTPEKFETLYGSLLDCGICTWEHVEVLANVIFEKATVQATFVAMYADLCARLVPDLCDAGCWFRHVLLSKCWEGFEGTFQSPPTEANIFAAPSGVDSDEEEARALRRKRALGNVRFMGELLIRALLFPEDLFACSECLLRSPSSPGSLEALAALLKVVGPFFDDANWTHHAQLRVVFWHIRGVLFDPTVPKRVRCLLRDVLDLREAGWIDTKVATKVETPKRLEEVRREDLPSDDSGAWAYVHTVFA